MTFLKKENVGLKIQHRDWESYEYCLIKELVNGEFIIEYFPDKHTQRWKEGYTKKDGWSFYQDNSDKIRKRLNIK